MSDPKRMSQNDRLRHDRLTFYKDDVDRIDKLLAEFLRLSGAKCALLIDKEGHLVTVDERKLVEKHNKAAKRLLEN